MTCSSLDILGVVSAVFYVSAGIKGQRMDRGRDGGRGRVYGKEDWKRMGITGTKQACKEATVGARGSVRAAQREGKTRQIL